MKKILHINEFFLPFYAGPSKHMYDVIRNTFNIDHHIVVCFDKNIDSNNIDSFQDISVKRFLPLSSNVRRMIQLNDPDRNILEFIKFTRNIDPICIVIYFAGILPKLITHFLPEQRIIYFPFGFYSEEFEYEFNSNRIKIALCGQGSYESFVKAGARKEQIFIIERPIDTNFFVPQDINRCKKRLLHVGRFHPIKRIPQLIVTLKNLLQKYNDLYFCIVADLNPTFSKKTYEDEIVRVKKTIVQNKLNEQVLLCGKKVEYELLEEYSKSYVHILTSMERRSTVTQEAITMGMQCVNVYKHEYDWPEFTDSGEKLIHYVDDIDFIPTVVENLLQNSQFTSNRNYALKHWSWDQWRLKYEQLLTKW